MDVGRQENGTRPAAFCSSHAGVRKNALTPERGWNWQHRPECNQPYPSISITLPSESRQ